VFEGKVYDKSTREPLPGAYVYMNGTSIYTTTDSSGVFKLSIEKFINASLVVAHMAYDQIVVANPFENLPESFYLEEKRISMEEVRIVADRYTKETKLAVFKEQFLGMTRAGKMCRIENEGDIVIKYDPEEKVLTAYSINPLIVHNSYLGYRIEFNLVDFKITYADALSIENHNVVQSYFLGNSSFIDLEPYKVATKRRRDAIYKQSSVYFMKQLVNRDLESANFRILDGMKRIEIDDCFIITDQNGAKSLYIRPGINDGLHSSEIGRTFRGAISVMGRGSASRIVFLTDRILVDQYGNIDKIGEIIFYGEMGDQRLGDTLPLDYNYGG